MKLPLMKAGTVPPEPMPGGRVECVEDCPLVLDDEMIDWLRDAVLRHLMADFPVKDGVVALTYWREAVTATADDIAKSLRKNRRLIEAVVAAEKRLGSGTWTGSGSVFDLIDAARACGRMLP